MNYKYIKKDDNLTSTILSPIGDGVISTDIYGKIIYINQAAENILDLKIDEDYNEDFDTIFAIYNTVEMNPLESPILRALKAKASVGLENRSFVITKNGVKKYISASCSPIRDSSGIVSGVVVVFRDITELIKAEDNLKLYNMLSENTNDIILFVDMDGKIIEANNAAIKAYGYTHEELCSLNIHDIRDEKIFIRKQMKEAYDKGIFFQTFHRRKDGSIFQVEVSSKGTTMGNKHILLSIIRDITNTKESEMELKRAKEAAEVASKAKGEFLANMSHEIRTPINGIVGMIDLTLLTDLTDEQKDNLLTAKSCANSLLNIINDILDFSKMEAGKLTIENISFNIKDLIEDVIKAHSPSSKAKGLDFKYTFSSSIPKFLMGDPNRLRQILNNLISNAIKFTDIGSINVLVKELSITNEEAELMFRVSDTGIGVAPDDISQLFRSFSQVDASYTKRFGGTGLGLAITKQLVEMMGGSICVESEKGKGSIFCFLLKFKLGSPLEKSALQLPLISKTIIPINILLVEDDKTNQKVIKKMLTEKGHNVETANNGKEALILFDKGKYDVILMDIHMPIMNGIEAAKKIKELDNPNNPTPIIALTAYALQGDREKFLSMGMEGYISKPIQMDELFYALDRIASMKKDIIKSIPERVVINEKGEINFTTEDSIKPNLELMPNITQISDSIKEMEQAIENNDYLSIENIAHNIKIISNKIDAVEIKDGAFKIELAARRGNLARVKMQMEKIKHKFETYKESIL